MEINYDAFKRAIKEENYEDAFYILFHMIDNSDPDAVKADKKWTRIARKNSDNKTIQALETKYRELPRDKKKDIESKYTKLLGVNK